MREKKTMILAILFISIVLIITIFLLIQNKKNEEIDKRTINMEEPKYNENAREINVIVEQGEDRLKYYDENGDEILDYRR